MFKINDKNNTVTPATSLISHLFLSVYIVDFEKVNVCWVSSLVSDIQRTITLTMAVPL